MFFILFYKSQNTFKSHLSHNENKKSYNLKETKSFLTKIEIKINVI